MILNRSHFNHQMLGDLLVCISLADQLQIVNISSVGGRIWMPIGGWDHAAKHALEVLSDVLRVETRPFGVYVVVVQPGAIQTEWAGISADSLDRTSPGSAYHAAIAPMARALRNFGKAVVQTSLRPWFRKR